MRESMLPDDRLEPDRYELREKPAYQFALNRREFLEVAGAGLLITCTGTVACGQRGGPGGAPTVDARLHIGEDGAITVFTGKVELGQGSRTQISQAAAEELRVPVESLRLIMADTDLVPNDGGTAGSRTTPSTIPAVRKGTAAARQILASAAARSWNVEPGEVTVSDGAAVHPGDGRRYTYADLARSGADALKAEIPEDVELTPVGEWKVMGKPEPKIGARDIVTGAHRYPSDIERPGMLYGAVLRAPSFGSTLVSVDIEQARKLEGVVPVHDGNFAGCAAPTSHQARKGVAALGATAKWETTPQPADKDLFEHLKKHAVTEGSGRGGPRVNTKGSLDEALSGADRVMEATYEVAYIQHAPMEPRAAVAEWTDGKLTVWTGTQQPNGVHEQVAEAFHLPFNRVRVIVPDTGGGFGGKHTGETAVEAARLAKAAGKPVHLRWTRDEEFTWAYFRPAGLYEMRAGLNGQGRITAWDYTVYNSGTAAVESPYSIPNTRTRYLSTDAPLRQGSYRAIAATANNFAREAFMDELAGDGDPLDFRLANAEDERLRAVLEAAAERFRWKERRQKRQAGVGVGIAAGHEKGSYVATCVEVEVKDGAVRVREICEAFECGAIQNPRNLRSQVEGCIIMGLGGALTEEIRFENGKILNGRFSRYPVPRIRDIPPLDCVYLDRKDLPSVGAGETPMIAVAPAIASAVYHATGERIRRMPVRPKTAAG